MCANYRLFRRFKRFLCLTTLLILACQSPVSAREANREEVLREIQGLSSPELLVFYQESQMMLQYAELAEHGIKIQTPHGTLSKKKAKKISREFQQRIELSEQVMEQRGFANLEGEYKFLANGDCEGAKAWWAALGGDNRTCGDLKIRQEGMNISVVQSCELENRKIDLENSGITVDNAVLIVEEINSDYQYVGTIADGVISMRVDADRALGSWPSFEKPPSKGAMESCKITLQPN
jgi:hypothetical protein